MLVTEREGSAPRLEESCVPDWRLTQLAQARVDLLLAVEQLKDLVLTPRTCAASQELDLTVARSEPIARNQADGPFANPACRRRLYFSEEVLEEGHNSDVIELGDDRSSCCICKHNPPQVRSWPT